MKKAPTNTSCCGRSQSKPSLVGSPIWNVPAGISTMPGGGWRCIRIRRWYALPGSSSCAVVAGQQNRRVAVTRHGPASSTTGSPTGTSRLDSPDVNRTISALDGAFGDGSPDPSWRGSPDPAATPTVRSPGLPETSGPAAWLGRRPATTSGRPATARCGTSSTVKHAWSAPLDSGGSLGVSSLDPRSPPSSSFATSA